jgi:hypothetical protein
MKYCPTDVHRVRAAAIKFDLIMAELIPARRGPWITVERLKETIQPYCVMHHSGHDYYSYDCYGPQKDLLITAYVCAGMYRASASNLDRLVLQRKKLIAKLRSLRS